MKTETEVLMQEYFKNKDKLKVLKYKRINYAAAHTCWVDNINLEIKKLAHRNKGILLRVRGLTK